MNDVSLLVTTLFLLAQPPAPGCATACPCIVPAGVDWRSARVMVPQARSQAAAIFLGTVVGVDTLARDTVWMGGDSSPGRRPIISPRPSATVSRLAESGRERWVRR